MIMCEQIDHYFRDSDICLPSCVCLSQYLRIHNNRQFMPACLDCSGGDDNLCFVFVYEW